MGDPRGRDPHKSEANQQVFIILLGDFDGIGRAACFFFDVYIIIVLEFYLFIFFLWMKK